MQSLGPDHQLRFFYITSNKRCCTK